MANPNPRRSGDPAKRAAASRQTASRPRNAMSARSRGALVRLAQLPPLVIPGLVLVLMLVGLAAPLAFALPALGLIALFVGWLAYLSWPILTMRGRLTRGLLIGIVLGSAVARAMHWL